MIYLIILSNILLIRLFPLISLALRTLQVTAFDFNLNVSRRTNDKYFVQNSRSKAFQDRCDCENQNVRNVSVLCRVSAYASLIHIALLLLAAHFHFFYYCLTHKANKWYGSNLFCFIVTKANFETENRLSD